MALFCVFTPTYNRAYTLTRLYESLKKQTFSDFVWTITDDGSTDDTDQLIQSFIREGILDIRYNRCANGGKTRAVIAGAQHSDEELFLCVDSDDWLTEDALSRFHEKWEKVKSDESVAGMIALRGYSNGEIIGTRMPKGLSRTNAWDLYYRYRFKGDCIHVYRTAIFNKYPAPVAEGEKFISEGWTIHHIAREYDVELIDDVLYLGDYLPDGLSRNVRELTKNNPIGYSRSKAFDYEMSHSIWLKFYNSALYMVGCMLAKRRNAVKNAPNRAMAIIAIPAAWVLLKTVFK